MNFFHRLSLLFAFVWPFAQVSAQFTIDLPGASSTYVTGINNDDNICGYYSDAEGNTTGYYRIGTETYTYRYNNQNTWLGGINNSNLLVGRYNPSGANTDFHAFILDPENLTVTDILALDGYEFMNPHDINDNGQISGDVKTGVNRRFFIWDEDNGLNTQNFLIGGSPAPTYGGYSIDNSGRVTGYYIDGANYYSFRYHPDFGFMESVDLGDPEAPTVHKTRLMGANGSGKAVLDFILSDNCHVYDFNNTDAWTGLEKLIPGSTEIHGLDINDSNHMVGYYMDGDGVVHGFADFGIGSTFDLTEDGHAFTNSTEDLWDYDWESLQQWYQYDPYWSYYGYNYDFPEILPGYLFPPTSYPSWPTFVTAMSLQSCYFSIDHNGIVFDVPTIRPNAFFSWKIHRNDNFQGACFGMAANAGASWQYPELLNEKFNPSGLAPFLENIYSLGQNEVLKSAAHGGMAAQASQTYASLNAAVSDEQPHQLLNGLHDIFLAQSEVPIIGFNLTISSGQFGHAVFPYAIIPEDLNTYRLMYYDPNEPGNQDKYFTIRYDENYSYYSALFGSETTPETVYGMQFMFVQEIYEPQLIPGFQGDPGENLDGHSSEDLLVDAGSREEGDPRVFSLGANPLSIVGGGGEITVNGNMLSNSIPGAKPWLTYGGQPQTLNQFMLPPGSYEISTIENQDDENFTGGLIDGENIIMFHRAGSALSDEDIMTMEGTELSYLNQISDGIDIMGEVLSTVPGAEYHFLIDDLSLDTDQSISLQFIDEGLYISNNGTDTDYNVSLDIYEDGGELHSTEVSNIPIGEGITQIIIPRFINDVLDGFTITETDDDPGTEDVVIEFGNEGLPQMIVSTDSLLLNNDAQLSQFGVGNIGAGTLNWSVINSPSWAPVSSGSPGINYGTVDLSVEQNPGAVREGVLTVQNNENPNDIRDIYIQQSDLNNSIDGRNQEEFQLMPNPSTRFLTVTIPSMLQGNNPEYRVLTIDGKLMMSGNCNNAILRLDFTGLSEGIYILELSSGEVKYVDQFVKISE